MHKLEKLIHSLAGKSKTAGFYEAYQVEKWRQNCTGNYA
jgi:hypothetical protein